MRPNALTASSWRYVCSQMINDPEYMRAAKKKLDEMQRRRVGVILGILCDKRVKL